MGKTLLPSSIANALHIRSIDEMNADRLAALDAGVIMIYLIDSAPAVVLPYLAAQFNMLGYNGWKFADTEQKQRDLLKRSIELHRYKGTPYGLKQALALAGVVGTIELQERVTLCYNGEVYHDGLGHYGNHWAYFRVLLDTANVGLLSIEDIRGIIQEYKGARNWLLSISYKQTFRDSIQIAETFVDTIV